jgi:hypothetical protein
MEVMLDQRVQRCAGLTVVVTEVFGFEAILN